MDNNQKYKYVFKGKQLSKLTNLLISTIVFSPFMCISLFMFATAIVSPISTVQQDEFSTRLMAVFIAGIVLFISFGILFYVNFITFFPNYKKYTIKVSKKDGRKHLYRLSYQYNYSIFDQNNLEFSVSEEMFIYSEIGDEVELIDSRSGVVEYTIYKNHKLEAITPEQRQQIRSSLRWR